MADGQAAMSTFEVYDVGSDTMRPVIQADVATLRQLAWAYGRLREARERSAHLLSLQQEMDRIHLELLRRLA